MNRRIYIYNENCALAGRQVSLDKLERHGEDCSDWHGYELTEEEAAYAEQRGGFGRKVAATIRAAMAMYPTDGEGGA